MSKLPPVPAGRARHSVRAVAAILLLALAGFWEAPRALAQANALPPERLTYQGFLADGNGTALATNAPKNYNVVFRIWDAQTGGTNAIWAEQQTVTVDKGYFSVLLGEGTQVTSPVEPHGALSTLFTNGTASDRFVDTTVKGIGAGGIDVTILPRLRLLTSPYAYLATKAISANSVDGGAVSSGTVSDARLGANVALLNRTPQDFTGINTFTGKVGIGAAPGQKLHVTGGNIGITPNASATSVALLLTDSGYSVKGQLAIAGTTGALSSDAAANDIVFRAEPGGKLLLQSGGPGNSGPSALAISAANKVGIGTASPSALLDIRNNSGANESIRLSGAAINATQGTSAHGISFLLGLNRDDLARTDLMIGNSRALAATDSVVRIIPGLGNVSYIDCVSRDGGTFKDLGLQGATMILKANGDVGIGVPNPTKAKLEINGASGNFNLTTTFREYSKTSVGGVGALPNSTGVNSIYASGRLTGQDFIAFSDERIKRVEGRSDPARDLAMLQGIEVTDYAYIDTVAKGPGKYKKVIAQQVEKVFPQAVSQSTDVVPDIYQKAAVKDGWVKLATNLKQGERVRLIGEKKEGIHEVLEVAEGRFRTEFKPEGGQVFVYGREVTDFRSVDYEAISMLNVSATQELAKRLEKLEARELHVAELERKAGRVATLEQEVADLKKMVAQLAKASRGTEQASHVATPARPLADAPAGKTLTTASLER